MDAQVIYIIVAIIAIGILIGSMRKGSTDMAKPAKTEILPTKLSGKEAMKIIIQFANENNYKIEDFDENKSIIVLSQGVTMTSNGFFFPIYISEDNDETIVEIGIKSKVIQIGPIVNRTHEQCYNGIKTALYSVS